MKSEVWRRRALYWASGGMWVTAAGLAVHAIVTESFASRTELLFALAFASCLTTASLFAVFVAPLERVYRHGYEAGQRASMWRDATELRMSSGLEMAAGAGSVVPFSALRRSASRRS